MGMGGNAREVTKGINELAANLRVRTYPNKEEALRERRLQPAVHNEAAVVASRE